MGLMVKSGINGEKTGEMVKMRWNGSVCENG